MPYKKIFNIIITAIISNTITIITAIISNTITIITAIISNTITFILTFLLTNYFEANINNNFKNTPINCNHNTVINAKNIVINYNNQDTTTQTFPNNHNNHDIYESLEITIKKIDNDTYTGKINSIEQKYKKITFQNENLKQKFNLQATKNSKYIVSVLVNYNPNNTIKKYEIIEYLGTTD